MREVVTSVRDAAVIMGDITMASRVQNDGIAEVNAALAQLDGITPQNAGLVEESAVASASVAEQAGHLAQVLSVFKLAPVGHVFDLLVLRVGTECPPYGARRIVGWALRPTNACVVGRANRSRPARFLDF